MNRQTRDGVALLSYFIGFSSILCGSELIDRPSGAPGISRFFYPGLKPGAIDGHPFGVKAIELSATAHLAAPEGHPIIARGFTPWKRKREKTRALKGRPIMCVYPSPNPHKVEENPIY